MKSYTVLVRAVWTLDNVGCLRNVSAAENTSWWVLDDGYVDVSGTIKSNTGSAAGVT